MTQAPDRGRRIQGYRLWVAALLLALVPFTAPSARQLSGREILERVEQRLWGHTSQGLYEMTITTPHWQRTLELKMWMERPKRAFMRILSPAKEAGIGSLRINNEMWNYLPRIERTIKIPPSMMLQPWMGSDFTNDDLVKESSIVTDYTHKILGVDEVDGTAAYIIEAMPRLDAAVVWGKLIYRVRQTDLMPLSQGFYSERGELIKTLKFSEVRTLGGRRLPTRWEMHAQKKPGSSTVIRLREVIFDRPVDPQIFTLRNLRGG